MAEVVPGVVVTFFPDEAFARRLARVAREVSPLLVVDNSTEAGVRASVARTAAETGAEYVAQSRNRGIAGGLNAGFSALVQRGHRAAVAFDQDSTPDPGCAAALCTSARADSKRAIVGSNWFDEARPEFGSRHLQPHPWLPGAFRRVRAGAQDLGGVTFVIASGSWFDLQCWESLGGFDAALFLDLVDVDFCLRARRLGRTVAVAAAARLAHNRGSKRPIRCAGRTWWPAFMPPARLRGLFANRIRLLVRHGWSNLHWVSYEACSSLKILGEIIFLEDQKREKLTAVLAGCVDAVAGRIPPDQRVV